VLLGSIGSPVRGSNVATFTASDVNHAHADRGWVGDGGQVGVNDVWWDLENSVIAKGYGLAMALIRLDSYKTTTTLPSGFMTQLETNFDEATARGVRFVVRCVYNYSSGGGDTTLGYASGHIEQLGALFTDKKAAIAYIEGGFVGSWGEWNNVGGGSTLVNYTTEIRDELLAHMPTDRYVLIPNITSKMSWYTTPADRLSIASGGKYRLGMYNDLWLGGNFDGNRYGNGAGGWDAAKLAFAQTDSLYNPMGGETDTAGGNLTTERVNWSTRGAEEHFTYFRASYELADFHTWLKGQSSGGTTAFNHMGYLMGAWLEYKSFACNATAPRGKPLVFDLRVRNRGWSRFFLPKRVRLILVPTAGGSDISLDASGIDPRQWYGNQTSGQAHAAIGAVTIPGGAATGTHWVHVAVVDDDLASDVDYNVRPGNTDSGNQAWDGTRKSWNTGVQVTIT
jgi:hypothetical protein